MITFDFLFIFGWVLGLVLLPAASMLNTWNFDRQFGKALVKGNYFKYPLKSYRLYPPQTNEKPMATMTAFFSSLAANFTTKTPRDIFVEGNWHDNISFEIHSNGGNVQFYVVCKEFVKNMIADTLKNHYPEAFLKEVEDPFLTWPREWKNDGSNKFPRMFGVDIVPVKHDINPTAGTKNFQKGFDQPDYDPITQLISVLEEVKPDSYAVVQLVIRAWPTFAGGYMDSWSAEFNRLRKELTENAAIAYDESGRMAALTQQEKDTLDEAQRKMNSEIFKVKFRYVYMMAEGESVGLLQGRFFSFLKQFNGLNQLFRPQIEVKTNFFEGGIDQAGRMGDIAAAKFAESRKKIYWEKEWYYREKKAYAGMLKRGLDTGSEPWLIDADALAAIFHFPITTTAHGMPSLDIARLSNDYGKSTHEIQIGNPPENLPG